MFNYHTKFFKNIPYCIMLYNSYALTNLILFLLVQNWLKNKMVQITCIYLRAHCVSNSLFVKVCSKGNRKSGETDQQKIFSYSGKSFVTALLFNQGEKIIFLVKFWNICWTWLPRTQGHCMKEQNIVELLFVLPDCWCYATSKRVPKTGDESLWSEEKCLSCALTINRALWQV